MPSPLPEGGDQRETVSVLRPQLPTAERLLPYLRRIDQMRIYSNHGPLGSELSERLASMLQLPEGGIVCASSGTAALSGAVLATAGRGTPERPLALLPAFTFVATAAAVEHCGYRAYLADVDAESWMLDPERLTDHPQRERIGVAVPVAPFGRPVPQDPWQVFSRKTGIPVVIDGAASFEPVSQAPERFLGALPVAFSFHATKSLATGEGGGVATSDLALAERIVRALNFGFFGTREARSASLNGKMSEYHAAVGLAELDDWPAKSNAFRAVADQYRRMLREIGLSQRFHGSPELAGCYALFQCAGDPEVTRVSRSLEHHGIDFRLWYGGGVHRQSYFADLPSDDLSITDDLAPRLLGLPTAPDLAKSAIRHTVAALAEAIRR
jgi:dTDP-4-amino-4,6-dideoxygalactose transaminase